MSVMHIVLCRKPVEGTVSSNVVEHGTGGLNIDGSRIGVDGGTTRTNGSNAGKPRNTLHGGNFGVTQLNTGRFPANVILSHHPDCVCVGKKKVRGSKPIPSGYDRLNKKQAELGYRPNEYQKGKVEPSYSHVDSDGNETIESWECHDDCPIRKLDEQSGERKGMSGGGQKGNKKNEDWIVQPFNRVTVKKEWVRGDTGGASRFFKNIQEE